ncbi:MAG: integrin [Planctomycetota bacterium]|nr:integrin [Planctomycetota bacterium]
MKPTSAPVLVALLATLATPAALAQGVVVQDIYLKASNTDMSDQFGAAVAASGATLVVGAGGEDSAALGIDGDEADNTAPGAGAAYVFVESAGVWSHQAYVKASNTGAADGFGAALAIDGDTLVVGAKGEDSSAAGVGGSQGLDDLQDAGAVYVFVRSGATWTQQAYLKASTPDAGDFFGQAVAIHGDTLVVGAPGEDSAASGIGGSEADNTATNSGAVYVFRRSGATWSQEAYLKAPEVDAFDEFGGALALSGDTLLVGAALEDGGTTGVGGDPALDTLNGSGAAYVYTRQGTTWSLEAYVKASNTGIGDRFGSRVDLDGDLAVVGAAFEDSAALGVDGDGSDDSGTSTGAAYVFERAGTTWSQVAYLKASNTQDNDQFGGSVAVSAGRVVVGAAGESAQTYGVNGYQGDNKMQSAGAAYLFEREAGPFAQTAYLKVAYPNGQDAFGKPLALAADRLVVGAPFESSEATGVGGNQTLNGSYQSGAAYAFDLAAPCGSVRYGVFDSVNSADLYSFDQPTSPSPIKLRMSGFRNAGTALLVFAPAAASVPNFLGGTLYIDLATFSSSALFPTPIAGGSGQLNLSVPPGAGGALVYLQAAMLDATKPGGWAFTNGLELSVCP